MNRTSFKHSYVCLALQLSTKVSKHTSQWVIFGSQATGIELAASGLHWAKAVQRQNHKCGRANTNQGDLKSADRHWTFLLRRKCKHQQSRQAFWSVEGKLVISQALVQPKSSGTPSDKSTVPWNPRTACSSTMQVGYSLRFLFYNEENLESDTLAVGRFLSTNTT